MLALSRKKNKKKTNRFIYNFSYKVDMFYVINPLNELLSLLTVYRKCAQCPLHGGGGHFVG